SDLVALLQAGELDYIVDYESLARANHLRYIRLPAEIDLGDPARAAQYARVSVRVPRRARRRRAAPARVRRLRRSWRASVTTSAPPVRTTHRVATTSVVAGS